MEEQFLSDVIKLIGRNAPIGFAGDTFTTPCYEMKVSTFILNDDQLMSIKIIDRADLEEIFFRVQLIPDAVVATVQFLKEISDMPY